MTRRIAALLLCVLTLLLPTAAAADQWPDPYPNVEYDRPVLAVADTSHGAYPVLRQAYKWANTGRLTIAPVADCATVPDDQRCLTLRVAAHLPAPWTADTYGGWIPPAVTADWADTRPTIWIVLEGDPLTGNLPRAWNGLMCHELGHVVLRMGWEMNSVDRGCLVSWYTKPWPGSAHDLLPIPPVIAGE